MKAKLIRHDKITDELGNTTEIRLWSVPKSADKPHGFKYSLVYIVSGRRIIGYDNAEGKGDHRHHRYREEPYLFESLEKTGRRFLQRCGSIQTGRTMKIRKVRVGIKDLRTALDEFVGIARAIESEKNPVKKEKGVYFTGVEAFRKAITPKRLALLHAIKTEKPSSVRRLSEIAERDVSADIKFLEQIGLVDIKKDETPEREFMSFVGYDRILFEIAVS